MSQALPLIDAALRGALVALLLLLAWRLARDRAGAPAARVGVAFTLGLVVQAVSSTPAFEHGVPCAWQAPGVGVSVGNAVLFWLFVSALFDDEFRLRPWHVACWAAVAAVGAAHCLAFGEVGHAGPVLRTALRLALRWAPFLFALLAVLAAARHWRDDLVEQRRRLRLFIAGAGSVYTLAMVAARLSAGGMLDPTTATLDIAMLGGIIAVVSLRVLRFTHDDLLPAPQPAPPAAAPAVADTEPAPDEAPWELALQRLMTEQRAYRDEDLTVARLADRLGLPEYRLRRLINQRLGHRNFNAYVNTFRVADAQAALADPARREEPVLHIALESGFQSIGPFNRAFKATTGLTPTEFRRQAPADAG